MADANCGGNGNGERRALKACDSQNDSNCGTDGFSCEGRETDANCGGNGEKLGCDPKVDGANCGPSSNEKLE